MLKKKLFPYNFHRVRHTPYSLVMFATHQHLLQFSYFGGSTLVRQRPMKSGQPCSFPIHRPGEITNSHEPPARRNFFFAISLSKKIR